MRSRTGRNQKPGSRRGYSAENVPQNWQVLVASICVGLIAFAIFCFVNAGYRVVPKVSGGDIETLAARLASKVTQAT